jgi:XTP/dITP diphosphohydrolase
MRLVFATNNKHKLDEVAAILGPGVELTTPAGLGITEDIPETADTLEGTALQKARYVFERTGLDCFADDTGLEVAALGGEPGVRSARYAGEAHDFDDNNRLLLKNLAGATDRSARFRTVIALIVGGGGGESGGGGAPKEYLFEGRVEGRIIDEYRGDGGFGYDPIFIPEGCEATFAQMSADEKNKISHRARAVEKLKNFLEK